MDPIVRNRRPALVILTLALASLGIALVALPWIKRAASDTFGQGDYALVTTEGLPFTQDTLLGAPSAVFFGYSHCPDVCPTTLGDLATWQADLAREGKSLRTFFVTVDPERDSPAFLKDYVSWVPGVVGVSGPRAEIDKAIRAFRVYAARGEVDEDGDYFVDHTATILLFDADGRLFEPIGYQEGYDRSMDKIRRLLAL